MTMRRWFAVLVGAALFVQGSQTVRGADGKQAARFASLEAQAPEVARAQALAWLKGAAPGDAAKLQRAEAIWKQEAGTTVTRLLTQAVDSPERYKTVAALMLLDMQAWKDKDLGAVARKMGNIERRLELARGGPHTQKLQKEVVARLDELIKELENKSNGSSQSNGGSCPNGGNNNQPNDNVRSARPFDESNAATGRGPGNVDPKRLKEVAA